MDNIKDNLRRLGYDKWLQANTVANKIAELEVARVVSVHKDSYMISNGKNNVFAELTGKLLYAADSPIHLPTTGDWVYARFYDDDSHAVIDDILPRRTLLKRKTAGKNIEFQLIAANIDLAFVIQSLDANYNLRRLERYLVMINESDIIPVVLLSKCDLMPEEEIEEKINGILKVMPHIDVLPFSNNTGRNIDTIQNYLIYGKTCCLLGSSGVGKTTLLNNIIGSVTFETQPVRERDSKGRHTTSNRQLIQLEGGAMIIDTPGMRELGNMTVDIGIEETFSEIIELAEQCHFNNCTHIDEKNCAVLSAIEGGSLSEARLQNYIRMKKESSYHEMSYFEKRHKDKQFGKYCKSVMKQKKDKRSH